MRTERIFRDRVLRCWSLHTCGRQTRRLGAWAAELEGKRLGHALSASTSWSIAAGSLTSVQVNVRTPLSSRNQRPTSSPPRIPFFASLRSSGLGFGTMIGNSRSEEHTSELQSQSNLVCRLLLEKK